MAASHYGWNAWSQRAFWGYDEGGHAAYALSIRETHALPHPLSGWSTFHPPAYHALAAAAWAGSEPLGPQAVLVALRAVSAAGMLLVGTVVYVLARRFTRSVAIALAAATLALFIPAAQLAATMVGNEALAAGFSAAALLHVVSLQRDPRRLRAAALAGLFAGLAFATKYSGAWTVATCALPFLRRDLDRPALRSFTVCFGLVLLVSGPVYLRNLALVGTPFPLTRALQPMKGHEERLYAGPRRLADYAHVPWSCGRYPYVTLVVERGVVAGLNPEMKSVPCLAYAGAWFDPFGVRASRAGPDDGVLWGILLLQAGVIPTLLALAGFGLFSVRAVRSRGRAGETPLVVLTGLGIASFVSFTWMAPSLAAAKTSYLLPLAAPAGVFFASGCALLPRAARIAALSLSLAAAVLAAYVFTTGTVFPPAETVTSKLYWAGIGRQLPDSYIAEAAMRLLDR